MPPRISVFPKCYFDALTDGRMPLDGWILEEGFDFGSKNEIAAGATEVERLDADAVSGQNQTFL